jgi:hypothetical protein
MNTVVSPPGRRKRCRCAIDTASTGQPAPSITKPEWPRLEMVVLALVVALTSTSRCGRRGERANRRGPGHHRDGKPARTTAGPVDGECSLSPAGQTRIISMADQPALRVERLHNLAGSVAGRNPSRVVADVRVRADGRQKQPLRTERGHQLDLERFVVVCGFSPEQWLWYTALATRNVAAHPMI